MLDSCDQVEVTPAWAEIASRAELPVASDEFFAKQGPTPMMPDTRRGFHRMHLRTKAVLRYAGEFHAVYLVDLSRSGVGVISPVQLFPCSTIELWLPDGRHLEVLTSRCVRLAERCYHCGAQFTCAASP